MGFSSEIFFPTEGPNAENWYFLLKNNRLSPPLKIFPVLSFFPSILHYKSERYLPSSEIHILLLHIMHVAKLISQLDYIKECPRIVVLKQGVASQTRILLIFPSVMRRNIPCKHSSYWSPTQISSWHSRARQWWLHHHWVSWSIFGIVSTNNMYQLHGLLDWGQSKKCLGKTILRSQPFVLPVPKSKYTQSFLKT